MVCPPTLLTYTYTHTFPCSVLTSDLHNLSLKKDILLNKQMYFSFQKVIHNRSCPISDVQVIRNKKTNGKFKHWNAEESVTAHSWTEYVTVISEMNTHLQFDPLNTS